MDTGAMDVLIAGAGVGGLALAHGLLSRGHRVRVLEAAPSLRRGGAGVTIFNNGYAALAGLGLTLDGLGGRMAALHARTADGRPTMRVDLRVLGDPVTVVPREELIDRLADGLPAEAIRFDTPVADVRADGRVVAVDGAGAEHAADVLVGADGYRSAVRRANLDPTPAKDVGWATWQGLTPILPGIAEGTTGELVVGDAGLVGLLPAGNGRLQWWFDTRWSPSDPPPESPVAMLRQRFAAYAEPVPALLSAVSDAEIGLYPHVLHPVPDAWGSGPVTLLGDAAHAFPPTQAQGANQAIEDAWLLARTLTEPAVPALRRYERARARRVRRVSRMAGSEMTNMPPPRWVRPLTAALPPRLAGAGYRRLIRSFSDVLTS